jgi:hypothetical protein
MHAVRKIDRMRECDRELDKTLGAFKSELNRAAKQVTA